MVTVKECSLISPAIDGSFKSESEPTPAREFISQSQFFRIADWQITHVIPLMQNAWFTVLLVATSLLVPLLLLPIAYRRRRAVAVAAFLVLSLFIAGTATAKEAEAQ